VIAKGLISIMLASVSIKQLYKALNAYSQAPMRALGNLSFLAASEQISSVMPSIGWIGNLWICLESTSSMFIPPFSLTISSGQPSFLSILIAA